MKKILLLMATHMVCLFMCAQSQLVVTATNGSQTKIGLDKKPVVTLGLYGEKVKISYGNTVKELDVKDLTFEGVNADSKEIAIVDGVMIPLKKIKSIIRKSFESSEGHLASAISRDPKVSIYYAALQATHIADTLKHWIDMSYTWSNDQNRIDSCTWTNPKLCIPVAKQLDGSGGEYDNVAYPVKRYFNFTAFLVPDSILEEHYGITSLDDLRQKAHELYDPMYPEDSNVTDETDRRNALNRFISYHVIDRYGDYYSLTAMDNNQLQYNFNRMKYDICDWYGTLMPHSIMKFSFPSGPKVGLYVNRRGVRDHADERGAYVPGAKVFQPKEMHVSNTALNGIYHYINDIVAYDITMQQVVCNDRIRLDATTLSPDFMTKLTDGEVARGHTWGGNLRYDLAKNNNDPAANNNRSVGFKPGFVRNFEYNDDTHMHVRSRSLYFWSYEGDEVILKGKFDTKIKLPSLPAGKYELRLGTCVGFDTRGIVAFFIDNVPTDLIDMRPGGGALFGNSNNHDSQMGDDEAITAFDQSIHNLGWMMGPKCYTPGSRSSFDASANSMRDLPNTIRRVVGTFTTDGKSDHYLRMKQMLSENCEFDFDYIELVPSTVYDNDFYPESPW